MQSSLIRVRTREDQNTIFALVILQLRISLIKEIELKKLTIQSYYFVGILTHIAY
jgi:hypothetical protein